MKVEAGRIDHGLHNGQPQFALEEVVQLDTTVKNVLDMVDLQDTLVIVTADHSHGLTINGYPERGNDILGMLHIYVMVECKYFIHLTFKFSFLEKLTLVLYLNISNMH